MQQAKIFWNEPEEAISFPAPGPGSWQRDPVHLPLPLTRYSDYIAVAFMRGLKDALAQYGLMLESIEPALVNGLGYIAVHPVGAPPGAKGPPPKWQFKLLLKLHPEIRRRIKTAANAMKKKIWRDDVREWQQTLKPKSVEAHLRLQAIDPSVLDMQDLIAHLQICRAHCEAMAYQHFRLTVAAMLPVGDLLVHAKKWGGVEASELLSLLRGSSAVSVGVAADELRVLSDLIRKDAKLYGQLSAEKNWAAAYQILMQAPSPVRDAMHAYLNVVGFRMVDGYDISGHYALEMPELLVQTILHCVNDENALRHDQFEQHLQTDVMRRIPEKHRAEFRELLGEARLVSCLRDERGVYSDAWAVGLARRAILVAGARLVEAGRLSTAIELVDASHDEMLAMLRGESGPGSEELVRRALFREKLRKLKAPSYLGLAPPTPPPADWLPEKAARVTRAFEVAFSFVQDGTDEKQGSDEISGYSVYPGLSEGRARVVLGPQDFPRIEQGDILVTQSTTPYFNVVLPLLKGIVTDRGGILSHAAIVAREYGIPGVVGTRNATERIRDGVRVQVDGDMGIVRILS